MKQNIILLLLVSFLISFQSNTLGNSEQIHGNTYVLSHPKDSFYSLALEIAEKGQAKIIHEIAELKNQNVQYLYWVIALKNLTEEKLLEYSKTVYENNLVIIMGIISGQDIVQAKKLWRSHPNKNSEKVILTAEMKNCKIPANVTVFNYKTKNILPFTKENILKNISGAKYIQVNMHGAPRSWFCDKKQVTIKSSDLPNLDGAIVESQICDNFIPWISNSMVNTCIANGAAAYTGFVYFPISGSQLGAYSGLMFDYTWKDFSIGHVVQIQNKAALRNYAKLPHHFLMGNPKLYFSSEQPYNIIKDSLSSNTRRIIQLSNCKTGFLPIKITNGAKYSYIKISNGISHWENSGFFNRDIEMINIGKDKYVIIKNQLTKLNITLTNRISSFNYFQKIIKNHLHSKIFRRHQDGFSLILGSLLLIVFVIQVIKKKLSKKIIGFALLTAISLLIFNLVLDLVLINKISVTSKILEFNYTNYLGMFLLFLVGSSMFYKSESIRGKIWAVVVIISPQLMSVILASVLSLIRVIFLANNFNIQKTSYFFGASVIFDLLFTATVLFLLLKSIQKWVLVKF